MSTAALGQPWVLCSSIPASMRRLRTSSMSLQEEEGGGCRLSRMQSSSSSTSSCHAVRPQLLSRCPPPAASCSGASRVHTLPLAP
eukprot:764944-Hanusia_phi.AAC.1